MSTKFEQLLDYLINEETDKANELFHEIVVEKSRQIYENLIAEEEDEEEMDESADEEMDESEEEMDESREEDEEMDESADEDMDESEEELEDSYMMDGEDDGFGGGAEGDAADEFGGEIGANGPEDDEHGHEGQEDSAIMDIKNAIAELEAAFAELEQAQGGEEAEMGMDSDFDDEEGEDEGMGFMENRRVTREYIELPKIGNDWEKSGSQKQQGHIVGANTGEKMPNATPGDAPTMKWGNGKPTSSASAKNLDQNANEGQKNTGTTPNKVNKGVAKDSGEQFTGKDWETNSKPGNTSARKLTPVGDAHGLAKGSKSGNNGTEGAGVGSGSGDKAGQTGGGTNTKSIVDRKF